MNNQVSDSVCHSPITDLILVSIYGGLEGCTLL